MVPEIAEVREQFAAFLPIVKVEAVPGDDGCPVTRAERQQALAAVRARAHVTMRSSGGHNRERQRRGAALLQARFADVEREAGAWQLLEQFPPVNVPGDPPPFLRPCQRLAQQGEVVRPFGIVARINSMKFAPRPESRIESALGG